MGELTADVRLEIRGILVGVSLGLPETEFINDDRGSLGSLDVCTLLDPVVPTEGDPAIVGNWFLDRREASDCFCMELTVCEVSLEEDTVRGVLLDVAGVDVEFEGFSRATR